MTVEKLDEEISRLKEAIKPLEQRVNALKAYRDTLANEHARLSRSIEAQKRYLNRLEENQTHVVIRLIEASPDSQKGIVYEKEVADKGYKEEMAKLDQMHSELTSIANKLQDAKIKYEQAAPQLAREQTILKQKSQEVAQLAREQEKARKVAEEIEGTPKADHSEEAQNIVENQWMRP
jgi:chromosome segregation ATPase